MAQQNLRRLKAVLSPYLRRRRVAELIRGPAKLAKMLHQNVFGNPGEASVPRADRLSVSRRERVGLRRLHRATVARSFNRPAVSIGRVVIRRAPLRTAPTARAGLIAARQRRFTIGMLFGPSL